MNIDIHINLRPEMKPMVSDKPMGKNISYMEARNLPVPHNMEHEEHLVKKGDTLASIAEEYGLTAVQLSEFLREANGNDYLPVGQMIPIPTRLKEV